MLDRSSVREKGNESREKMRYTSSLVSSINQERCGVVGTSGSLKVRIS